MTESATLNPRAQSWIWDAEGKANLGFEPPSVNAEVPGKLVFSETASWGATLKGRLSAGMLPTMLFFPGAIVTYLAESDTSAQSDTTIEDSHQLKVQRDLGVLKERVLEPNWDKEGAPALRPSTFEAASEFARHLTLRETGLPDVDATPQGEIMFSWDSDDWRDSFDIAILPTGAIAVGGLFERLEVKGDMGLDSKSIARICDMARWTGLVSGQSS